MQRALVLLLPLSLLAGCGGSSKSGAPPATTTRSATTAPASTAATTTATTSGQSPPGALQPEAASAAAGDIPDNQVFLTFRNPAGGYSMKYPEGWAQAGSGKSVTFRDKNNIVRVVVTPGALPKTSSAGSGLDVQGAPQPLTIGPARALKVVYATESAPNPVTGKRVALVVDRYYVSHGGKQAIVDLGSPRGVDNVDAYRLMIQSFRWR